MKIINQRIIIKTSFLRGFFVRPKKKGSLIRKLKFEFSQRGDYFKIDLLNKSEVSLEWGKL